MPRNGTPHANAGDNAAKGEMTMTEYLPAAAGFQILWYQGDMVLDEEPIVGFICENDVLHPVTATGVLADRDELDNAYAVLHPDGHVEDDELQFPSLEAFEQYLEETGMPAIVAVP
jgi:hypothetical protein